MVGRVLVVVAAWFAAARRLYVNGFACCAAPSLLLGIDRLLGW